jgi:hypothetical protein
VPAITLDAAPTALVAAPPTSLVTEAIAYDAWLPAEEAAESADDVAIEPEEEDAIKELLAIVELPDENPEADEAETAAQIWLEPLWTPGTN